VLVPMPMPVPAPAVLVITAWQRVCTPPAPEAGDDGDEVSQQQYQYHERTDIKIEHCLHKEPATTRKDGLKEQHSQSNNKTPTPPPAAATTTTTTINRNHDDTSNNQQASTGTTHHQR
jgi:hypothetical protein